MFTGSRTLKRWVILHAIRTFTIPINNFFKCQETCFWRIKTSWIACPQKYFEKRANVIWGDGDVYSLGLRSNQYSDICYDQVRKYIATTKFASATVWSKICTWCKKLMPRIHGNPLFSGVIWGKYILQSNVNGTWKVEPSILTFTGIESKRILDFPRPVMESGSNLKKWNEKKLMWHEIRPNQTRFGNSLSVLLLLCFKLSTARHSL